MVGTNHQCSWFLELDRVPQSQQVWHSALQKVLFSILHTFHSTNLEVGAHLTAPHLASFSWPASLDSSGSIWLPDWIQVVQTGSTSLSPCNTEGTTLPDPWVLLLACRLTYRSPRDPVCPWPSPPTGFLIYLLVSYLRVAINGSCEPTFINKTEHPKLHL